MKNYVLFSCCLLFAAALCAQQKIGVGISAKAGNFTLPKKGPGPEPAGFTHSENSLSAGFSIGLGALGTLDFNRRWGLRAEILYGLSYFTMRENFNFDPQNGQDPLIEVDRTRQYTEHCLLLPLKVYVKLGVSAKTVLAWGVTPSFIMGGEAVRQGTPEPTPQLESSMFFPYGKQRARSSPSAQLLYAVSLHRRLDARTSLGVECTVSPNRNELDICFQSVQPNLYEPVDFPSRSPFSMKNVSVSLMYYIRP